MTTVHVESEVRECLPYSDHTGHCNHRASSGKCIRGRKPHFRSLPVHVRSANSQPAPVRQLEIGLDNVFVLDGESDGALLPLKWRWLPRLAHTAVKAGE